MGHPGELAGATLATLIGLVRKHTGIAMTEKKSVLLQGRLRPRMRALGLADYREYLELVERGGAELPTFIDLVTTNDTLFFRTPHVWEYFSSQFLPTWFAGAGGQTLRIWSAAAASGEEAYSIAMLCQEFQASHDKFRYQIFATDISQQILATARAGQYAGRSVEKVRQSHPKLAEKYLLCNGCEVQVSEVLKKQVSFAEHNLMLPLKPAQQFDIIFLRNVLIYFDEPNQEVILRQASLSMKPHARLVLGESESINRLNTAYRYELPLVYTRDGAAG